MDVTVPADPTDNGGALGKPDASLAGRPATSLGMPGSRALVVGTGSHAPGSRLPDIPAVADTVTEVSRALVERCGLGPGHVRTLTDPEDPRAFLRALTETTARAEDVLLFYYIGHGLVSLGGELYLATRETGDQGIGLAVEALSYATVRDALATCRARSIMVVLDCCFSGRAYGAFGTAVADAFELTNVRGSFLLSAASATEQALAPEGDPYTAFSGALLGFLRDGDPAAPRYLTFDDVYRHLSRVLPQRGLPAPHRRAGDRAGELILAVNPAAGPVTRRRPDRPCRDRGDVRLTAGRPCPYPGLSAFTSADAQYFFGRERLVADALVTVARRVDAGPVALVGRSGSGKSSLLQAGLLPAIKAGRLGVPDSRNWPQLVMTPGEEPLRALATRLAAAGGLASEPIRTRLAADPGQLAEIVDIALRGQEAGQRAGNGQDGEGVPGSGLVLCVDQFEEIFTACTDEGERRAFVQAVCAASRGGTALLLVILGIRADFYGHCMAHPELGPTLRRGQIPVQPMTAAELRTAIEGPADAAGLVLDHGLADRLLQDMDAGEGAAHDADGALPLLSYALQATWQESDGRVLTLADYQATGGIWQAVTQQADRTFQGLDEAAQDAAKLLLLRMVRLGEGTDDVRRRISLAELLSGRPAAEQDAIAAARDAFVGARLITVADDTAEITHEALLRAWPRLRAWLEDDRADLLGRQRLTDAAHTWDAEGREPGTLYSGARLELARQWLAGRDGSSGRSGSLSPLEREFLDTSMRRERDRGRRRRAVLAASIAVLLALATTGVYALQQRASGRASQAEQSSVQLAAEADALRASDPAGAMQLSLTAYSSAATPQARSSLYQAYTTPYPVPLPGRAAGAVVSVAYSPDGRTVAGSSPPGTIRLWRVTDPLHPALAAELKVATSGGSAVAFSPDSHLLGVHTQRALELWDVQDPAHPVRLSSVPVVASVPPHSGQFVPVAFSPDGRTVATGNGDGRFRLWDVADPRHPVLDVVLAVNRQAVHSVAVSPDGHILATASATTSNGPGGGRVRLWDIRDPHAPALLATLTVNSALAVAFSPVGHLLVAAGAGEDVHGWNLTDLRHPAAIDNLGLLTGGPQGTDSIDSVAFRPDGQAFVTTDTSGQTEIWTDSADELNTLSNSSLPDPAGTFSAAFNPNGQQLVTGDLSGAVELWTMLAPLLPGQIVMDGPGSSFGHHGTLLATNAPADGNGHRPGAAMLWDISDPLRPTLAATLPRTWKNGSFLADDHTLLTQDADASVVRLWDTADPRHPVAGATLAETGPGRTNPATLAAEAIAASDDSHLLAISIRSGDAVQVWDVRDFRRPVLDATITPGRPPQSIWFLTDHLLGIVGSGNMQLWDLANPRRPAEDRTLSDVALTTLTYIASSHMLTTASTQQSLSGSGASLWDLANPRKPNDWADGIDADPDAIAWITGQTLAGGTAHETAIELWDVRYPHQPSVISAVPIGSQATVHTMLASPDNQRLAAGIGSADVDSVEIWNISADHRSLADFTQMPGDSDSLAFSPDSQVLATNLFSAVTGEQLAFAPSGTPAVLYPLSTDSLYHHLCAMVKGTTISQGWKQYLPTTFYKPAC